MLVLEDNIGPGLKLDSDETATNELVTHRPISVNYMILVNPSHRTR